MNLEEEGHKPSVHNTVINNTKVVYNEAIVLGHPLDIKTKWRG